MCIKIKSKKCPAGGYQCAVNEMDEVLYLWYFCLLGTNLKYIKYTVQYNPQMSKARFATTWGHKCSESSRNLHIQ